MSALYQWVGGILCFLIFMTMVQNLLPSKNYEKYLRFFAGMVLILLVLHPLLGGLRLEERIAYYFEAINFQNEAQDLSREILGIEKGRLRQVIDTYEQAVEQDVTVMAGEAGFVVEEVRAGIDSDRESESFGMVTEIFLRLGGYEEAETEERVSEIVIEVAPVEAVKVEAASEERQDLSEGQQVQEKVSERQPVTGEQPEQEKNLKEQSEQEKDSKEQPMQAQVAELRRKVERYYGLESDKVKIEYQGR